jgi:hypothetical protein
MFFFFILFLVFQLSQIKQSKGKLDFSVSSVNFQHLRLRASEVFRLASGSYDQKFMCVQPQKLYIMTTAVKYSILTIENFKYFSGNTKVADRLAGHTGLIVNLC